jgi:hypothetical protein
MSTSSSRVCVVGFVVAACAVGPAAETSSTSEASETGTSDGSETETDTTETEAETDEPEYPSCDPREPGVTFQWTDPGELLEPEFDGVCTVAQIGGQADLALVLDCPDVGAQASISVDAEPSFELAIAVGDALRVRHELGGWEWEIRYLRLDRDDGTHLLSIVDGDYANYDLPHAITPIDDVCPADIDDFCGLMARRALAFDVDGQAVEVLDGTHATIDAAAGTEVWVARATYYPEFECTDGPLEWFRVLIVNPL